MLVFDTWAFINSQGVESDSTAANDHVHAIAGYAVHIDFAPHACICCPVHFSVQM